MGDDNDMEDKHTRHAEWDPSPGSFGGYGGAHQHNLSKAKKGETPVIRDVLHLGKKEVDKENVREQNYQTQLYLDKARGWRGEVAPRRPPKRYKTAYSVEEFRKAGVLEPATGYEYVSAESDEAYLSAESGDEGDPWWFASAE
eukprot:jgi/Mesvir1/17047/Mv16576-RA.1